MMNQQMKSTGTNPNIEIVFEDNHLLAINKPAGVLSQEDRSGSPDVLTICKEFIKKEYNIPGNVFLGLLHRLDQPVSGIMILAKTSKAASRISDQIRKRTVKKSYLAIVSGQPPANGTFKHYLTKDKSSNITRISVSSDKKAKSAELTFHKLEQDQDTALVEINLITGRAHQIRVQFAAEGFPLLGDGKYGSNTPGTITLHAYSLSITHPTLKNFVTFVSSPPKSQQWNRFIHIQKL